MRWIAYVCIVVALGACKEDLYFIPGTATLLDCNEPAVTDLDGSVWFDQGLVTIGSGGCQDTTPGDTFMACALNWAFTQQGNDVTIIVDKEYRIEGRLCGDELYLRGGWWLPVVDEDLNYCTYDDDSADEVGISASGNVLTYTAATGETPEQMTGTLAVQGSCSAEYEVTFARAPSF
jgi:hypothetical protein